MVKIIFLLFHIVSVGAGELAPVGDSSLCADQPVAMMIDSSELKSGSDTDGYTLDWKQTNDCIGGIQGKALKTKGFCTSTLVAPDIMLTAAHCLDTKFGGRSCDDQLSFVFSVREARASIPKKDVYRCKEVIKVGDRRASGHYGDYVFVRIDRVAEGHKPNNAISKKTLVAESDELTSVGYPAGLAMREGSGLYVFGENLYPATVEIKSAMGGISGGPLFTKDARAGACVLRGIVLAYDRIDGTRKAGTKCADGMTRNDAIGFLPIDEVARVFDFEKGRLIEERKPTLWERFVGPKTNRPHVR